MSALALSATTTTAGRGAKGGRCACAIAMWRSSGTAFLFQLSTTMWPAAETG